MLNGETHPLYNDNRRKLGIFCLNVSGGATATLAEGHWEATWPNILEVASTADRTGIEALVPLARWRGFGGPTNFNGSSFETFTWAAGLAAVTQDAAVFATSHVPTIHPLVAAKQGTTIDHISRGRFALNVVCGWYEPEFAMFGAPIMGHEERYAYAAEWLEIVQRLWTLDDEFDYEGRYFKIERGFHQPKPICTPRPPIMSAGSSPTGARFAAQYADMAFTPLGERADEENEAQIRALRQLGRDEFAREFQVWGHCSAVCRPTEKEAQDYLRYYVEEKGDWEAIDNLTRVMGLTASHRAPAVLDRLKYRFVAGWGGYPLVGTPEQIADTLANLSRLGVDGVTLSWVNFQEELSQWIREVMPLLEQAGLRRPCIARQ